MTEQPQPAPPPASAQSSPQRGLLARLTSTVGWLVVLLAVLALLGIGGALALLLVEDTYAGHIYPHISVQGHDLGFHSRSAAEQALAERYQDFLAQPVTLVYNGQTWQPSAAELGVQLDIDAAVADALALGRMPTRADSAHSVAAIWHAGVELPIRLSIDQATMQRYLLAVAASVEQPPRNANIILNGPHVLVTQEDFGVQMLIDSTLHDLTAALHTLERQPVAIRTRSLTPQVRDSDIAAVAGEARMLFGGPLVMTSDSCRPTCRWEWSPEHYARAVHLRRQLTPDGQLTFQLEIDQAILQHELLAIAEELHQPGELPRLAWNDGSLEIIEAGTHGSGLDLELALARVNLALRGGPRSFELPITPQPPAVNASNLASLGLSEPLGVGVSSFRGSAAYRITNIQAGAQRMHGVLIPPGESFSFNTTLGPVDAQNGFVPGYAIVQNRTQKEWGGGLCQVSTTVFRAAFWGGMPINERHEHTFRIPWYEELGEPPGLDATIYTGISDLRFDNDTDGYLLVQAYVDRQKQQLIIALYGQPQAREVEMSYQVLSYTPAIRTPRYIDDPSLPAGTVRQTDWAQPGMSVEVYRTVREGGQPARIDTFATTFQPWPDIYLRGTGGR
jgi:vancomycin resistance protein YoaR